MGMIVGIWPCIGPVVLLLAVSCIGRSASPAPPAPSKFPNLWLTLAARRDALAPGAGRDSRGVLRRGPGDPQRRNVVDARPRRDVGVILPRDYTLFLSRTFMIPKQATHKREAALLLEFLLSPQGQTMLAEVNLFQRIDRDARPLPDSARRAIPIDPKLLVAMDRHRRQLFVEQWRTTFARERED